MTGALGQPNARRYFFSFSAVALANYLLRYMYKNEDPKACKKEKEAQIEGKYVSSVAADKIARAVGQSSPSGRNTRRGKRFTTHWE